MASGIWLEGTITCGTDRAQAGLWFEMTGGGGFGVAIETGPVGNFVLGDMDSDGQWTKPPLQVDRVMRGVIATGDTITWKLLARNAWTGSSMIEFYVNDVLSVPFAPGLAFTGKFATISAATTVAAAHRLPLPGQCKSRATGKLFGSGTAFAWPGACNLHRGLHRGPKPLICTGPKFDSELQVH